MSERYGLCKKCSGTASVLKEDGTGFIYCGRCGGTGFSGDAQDYIDPAYALKKAKIQIYRDLMDYVCQKLEEMKEENE